MGVRKHLVVKNASGLHCRAAVRLMEAVRNYDAEVTLVAGNIEADCRSILDILALGCARGTRVLVRAEGNDAEAALAAVQRIFDEGFGEQ